MKQLTCEMCGSTDLVKKDGMYICQNCGTKYSAEEAKKMMIEGKVDVTGSSIKVDITEELDKLSILAHRAKDDGDYDKMMKYFEQISEKNPNDWESYYNLSFAKAMSYVGNNIIDKFSKYEKSTKLALELLKKHIKLNEDVSLSVNEIAIKTIELIKQNFNTNLNSFIAEQIGNKIEKSNNTVRAIKTLGLSVLADAAVKGVKGKLQKGGLIATTTGYEKYDNCNIQIKLAYSIGDKINDLFGGIEDCRSNIISLWDTGIILQRKLIDAFGKNNKLFDEIKEESLTENQKYYDLAKAYNPNYEPTKEEKKGCYVATCVYGSYDCPEVWVLRRYRDNVLSLTWYGRLFVSIYYFVSPTVVKWFGSVDVFKSICKCKLDKMVGELKEKGFKDTKYYD